MAKTNTARKTAPIHTHEGAIAAHIPAYAQLRRSVASCLLWEDEFYESGESIVKRILDAIPLCKAEQVAELAIEARSKLNLRHVPLLLLVGMTKHFKGALVGNTVAAVIQRADELAELAALYWKINGPNVDLSKQLKRGIAIAFQKFNAYQLAKYNRDGAVKLRDVLFLSHAKPLDDEQAGVWKQLVEGKLPAPDTWEVALSGGADKKEAFTRLLKEGKLGYLALLRNLRNMAQAGVDEKLVVKAIKARKNGAERVLPFRFIAAARVCPQFEPAIDEALIKCIEDIAPFSGKTVVLVDVSGSMDNRLSAKSDLTRVDAAAALASIIPGDLRVFSFSNHVKEVPARRGMSGVDAVIKSQSHGGTELITAVKNVNSMVQYDRMIVISDEQAASDASRLPAPPKGSKCYMINVASARNGIGYGAWVHIDGFSESVIRFMRETEQAD